MRDNRAKYCVGQVVHHRLFDYRGVVVDVDPEFLGEGPWLDEMVRTRPRKDQPWYRVLVDEAEAESYVAEGNLEPDDSGEPVDHPGIATHFKEFRGGVYTRREALN